MKIIADENIPQVSHFFNSYGTLTLKAGREITRDDLRDANILLVRSVTSVNEALLHDTPVKFVGSATTGIDHIDTKYLDQAGIQWAIAKGCNARAVVEFVVSVIAALQNKGFLQKKALRAGVIGVGQIGSQVVDVLKILGFEVIQHDPIRAEHESDFQSTPLEQFSELDLITLHTPLTINQKYPTYHLIDKNFLERQKKNCVLLNAGRGAVIHFADLKQYGKHLHWCLDVWENEPTIDLNILKETLIATPHIAGYSVQSKFRGVEMIYLAALQQHIFPEKIIPPIQYPSGTIIFQENPRTWRDAVLRIYDPFETSLQMKEALMSRNQSFDALRKYFIERHEFGYVELKDIKLPDKDRHLLRQFGINV